MARGRAVGAKNRLDRPLEVRSGLSGAGTSGRRGRAARAGGGRLARRCLQPCAQRLVDHGEDAIERLRRDQRDSQS